ncbi:hypothetical protein Llala01_02513 [Lactococcus lactis subsp. lactis]
MPSGTAYQTLFGSSSKIKTHGSFTFNISPSAFLTDVNLSFFTLTTKFIVMLFELIEFRRKSEPNLDLVCKLFVQPAPIFLVIPVNPSTILDKSVPL